MGIFDRIILTVYTFAFTFLSLAGVLTAAGWWDSLAYIAGLLGSEGGRWLVGGISAIFFISSIRLLYFAFRRGQSARSVVHQTELGQVRISLDAVESLASRTARQSRGVRDVRAYARSDEDSVIVRLRLWVSPDVSIPGLIAEMQREISRQIRDVVGVAVSRVDTEVENIAAEGRRPRVE